MARITSSRAGLRSRSRSANPRSRTQAVEVLKNDNTEPSRGFLGKVVDYVMFFIIYMQSGRDPNLLEPKVDSKQPVLFDSDLPFGISLFTVIMERDPALMTIKWIYLVITTTILMNVPRIDRILSELINSNDNNTKNEDSFLTVTSRALQLSENQIQTNFWYACIAFGFLILLHMLGLHWPKTWYDEKTNKYATSCYDEMFGEPLSCSVIAPSSKRPVLIARWGNTISNLFYLVTGICVTHSVWLCSDDTATNPFYVSDGLFGINLLLLSIFSTIWHSANYNKEHYLDLWAMDHAILYLVFRYVAIGINWYFEYKQVYRVALGLFIYYIGTFMMAFVRYMNESLSPYGVGMFDKGFPPSGRRRLTKVDDNGVPDMLISGTCLFWGLPIIYMILPSSIMYNIKHIGSPLALQALSTSLTIGWSYRMSERFCVDGNVVLHWVNMELKKMDSNSSRSGKKSPTSISLVIKGAMLRFVGALLSPTAVLHWLTGISLFMGYVHVRSLDQEIARYMN